MAHLTAVPSLVLVATLAHNPDVRPCSMCKRTPVDHTRSPYCHKCAGGAYDYSDACYVAPVLPPTLESVPLDRAIPVEPPTMAPVIPVAPTAPPVVVSKPDAPPLSTVGPVTFTRMAPCTCFQCKGTIPAGGKCALDGKGQPVHAECYGARLASRKATAPADAPAKVRAARAPIPAGKVFKRAADVACFKCPAPIPAGTDCTLDAKGRFLHATCAAPPTPPTPATERKPGLPVQADPPAAPTYEWTTCPPSNGLRHDYHVLDYSCINEATAKRDAECLPKLAPKPVEAAPIAKPAADAPVESPAPVADAGSFQADVDASSLKRAVALCHATADRRASMPILASVAVRSKGGRTVLQATDCTTWIAVEVPGSGRGDGAYTVPARTLKDNASAGGKGTVSLSYDGKALSVAGARLQGLPAADFPRAPSIAGAPLSSYSAESLRTTLETVLPAIATDDSRYHLSGVMLGNRDGHGVAVSTDGHRMHVVECESWPWAHDVIVPLGTVRLLARALKGKKGCETRIGLDAEGKWLHVRTDGLAVAGKLVDATFPPFEMVVPKAADRDGSITLLTEDLISACERCGKVSVERINAMTIEIADGMVTATADNPDKGSVKVEYACVQRGEPLRIGINGAYLLDWLATVKENTVTVEYQNALDPMVVRLATGRESLCVIMPMRTT